MPLLKKKMPELGRGKGRVKKGRREGEMESVGVRRIIESFSCEIIGISFVYEVSLKKALRFMKLGPQLAVLLRSA